MAEGVTGLLVCARTGSSRLPAKHLLRAGGRPMIAWLCARMAKGFEQGIREGSVKLIIATSTAPGNEAFADAVRDLPVRIFRGSDDHIPRRQLECALAHDLDRVISLDGDDVLCSFHGAGLVHAALCSGIDADIVATVGLPLGMNVSGYRTGYLQSAVEQAGHGRFETGWGRVFNAPRVHPIGLGDHEPDGPLRFTLDYEEDAAFFRAVIDGLGDRVLGIPDEDLISYVRSHELYRINMHMQERYFENFNSEREKEIDG